jgi:hypothetical protein
MTKSHISAFLGTLIRKSGAIRGMDLRARGSRVLVRYRKFERRLRAGIRLRPFVRQTGRIGKYPRFLILTGRCP